MIHFNFIRISTHTFKLFIPLNSQGLIIILSSLTYGLFSISIYLLLKGLNLKLVWFMTLFILFQIPALRTTWDLQKDIIALSFMF